MTTLSDYNLLGLDEGTLSDPYPFYRLLQREAPVYREPEFGIYLVSRYADVLDVVRQPLKFSSRLPTGPSPRLRPERLSPELRSLVERMNAEGRLPLPDAGAARQGEAPDGPHPTLLAADPPAHDRYRGMCNQLLNARRAREWEPRVREIANELVDRFIDRGRVEFVMEFAHPLPLRVVAELLGVPRSDEELLETMFGGPNAGEAIGNANVMVERIAAAMARHHSDAAPSKAATQGRDLFTAFFAERIAELRSRPVSGDFLSDLIQARDDDGATLTDAEVLSIIRHFRIAGHETSTKMLTAGLYYLVSEPEAMAAVRSDLSRCQNLVEETLRMEAPVQALFRVANEDCDVGGVHVPAGSMLMMLYGAANHDPDQFADPDMFDPSRQNARTHLAFGQGPHYCIGAPFARAEGRIGFEAVLGRTKHIAFTEGANTFERTASYVLRGIRELHLDVVAADQSTL